MRRAIFLTVLVCLLLGGGVGYWFYAPEEPTPPPSSLADACTIRDERPDWYRATRAAARKWDVPPPVLLAIVWRESAFRAQARPPRRDGWWIFKGPPISTAYGFSQALDGTWQWYLDDTSAEEARRDRYADAIDFVGWYMAMSRDKLGFTGQDARLHYLAYHQGHSGYRRGKWRHIGWLKRAAAAVEERALLYDTQLFECDSLHAFERSVRTAPVPRKHPGDWSAPVPRLKPDPSPALAAETEPPSKENPDG